MAGKDVAEMLGVSSAAVACNWARAAESPSPAAADRSPIEPMRDSDDRAYDGFEGSLEERVRQLELENDILGGGEGFKSRKPQPDDEQGEGPGHKRAADDDGEKPERAHRFLEDIEELLWVPAPGDVEARQACRAAGARARGVRGA